MRSIYFSSPFYLCFHLFSLLHFLPHGSATEQKARARSVSLRSSAAAWPPLCPGTSPLHTCFSCTANLHRPTGTKVTGICLRKFNQLFKNFFPSTQFLFICARLASPAALLSLGCYLSHIAVCLISCPIGLPAPMDWLNSCGPSAPKDKRARFCCTAIKPLHQSFKN